MENKELKTDVLRNKLILSWFLTLILLGGIGFYLIPSFGEVSALKVTLANNIAEYEKYEKDGLTYNEYLELPGQESIKKLIGEDENFYVKHLTNTEFPKYEDFLKSKAEYVNEKNKQWIVDTRNQKLSKVLPSYTQGYSVDWNMTDLAFVNYVETLLRTFSLRTTSKIWIEDLIPVESNVKNINTQLFYIPLKLDLVGRKADIVEFIYFLQNVWVVSLDENDLLVFHKDNVVSKVIAGERKLPNYNIYENKIIDVDTIELLKYIDTSSSIRGANQLSGEWFINYIVNGTEKDNEFPISVNLKFYVKGLPTYRIELFVEQVVAKYNEMNKTVKSVLADINNGREIQVTGNKQEVNSIFKWLDKHLTQLEQTVKKLEQWVKQKNNFTTLYKDASDLNYELWNLEQYINSVKIQNKSSEDIIQTEEK